MDYIGKSLIYRVPVLVADLRKLECSNEDMRFVSNKIALLAQSKEGAKLILIGRELYDYLAFDEVFAIVAHEEGHIHFNHGHSPLSERKMMNQLMQVPKEELEADDYAVERVGLDLYSRALIKLYYLLAEDRTKLNLWEIKTRVDRIHKLHRTPSGNEILSAE